MRGPLRSLAALLTAPVLLMAVACSDGNDPQLVPFGSATPVPATRPAVAVASATPPAAINNPPTGSCGSGAGGIGAIQRTGTRTFSAAPPRVIDTAKAYVARMQTSKGEITLLLAAADVPGHVNNFVFLACNGYYDGLTFHRVELNPPFVIQGGDPQGNGSGGPGYQIPLEISPKWRHDTGALAMARSPAPNSAGSQFYITLAPQAGLDNQYSVFGRVIRGMEVVREIRVGDRITRVDIDEY